MSTRFVGEPVQRTEDPRLLTGQGRYTDDFAHDAVQVAFVRSVHAHARIVDVDVSDAATVPGVHGVFTFEDLEGPLAGPLPQLREHAGIVASRTPYLLAREEAHYAGQPIAMVVASSRYVAEDAAALVQVEYEPLPAIVDPREALEGGAVTAHGDMDDNLAGTFSEQRGNVEAALARSAHVIEAEFELDRGAAHPMEARAVVASPDAEGRLRVYDTTQAPMIIRGGLAGMFGLDPDDVEVVAPFIGGGFGVKVFQFYPEEVLVPWAAMRLGQTVKWTEDRREHFLASNHSRKQIHRIRLGVDADGHIQGYDVDFVHDSGAYCQYGMHTAIITAAHLAGPYRIDNLRYRLRTVYTNTVMNTPYRGSGVPYAVFALERVLDKAAAQLVLDRAEIRRRNLLAPDEFPRDVGITFPTGGPTVYDSGEYERGLDLLLEAIQWDGFQVERERAAAEGRKLGIGLACYVEASGPGPYEGAKVNVLGDGSISVATAATPAGQGHETLLAQVVADEFDVPLERVRVTTGDTRHIAYGMGTYASRTAVLVGTAAQRASREVRRKLTGLASHMLEAAPEDIELTDGFAAIKGVPEARIPIGAIAQASQFIPPAIRGESEPGVSATEYVSPMETIFGNGMHAAVVEVDPDTCSVNVLRYAIVHDCGRVLNPLLVEGQVLGGFAQGIGGALYEQLVYDEAGQLLTGSFMDFLIPYATEVPAVELRHTETPSPTNELGLKGAGEAGAIPVAATIASAVGDALGVEVDTMPLNPQRLFELGAAG